MCARVILTRGGWAYRVKQYLISTSLLLSSFLPVSEDQHTPAPSAEWNKKKQDILEETHSSLQSRS